MVDDPAPRRFFILLLAATMLLLALVVRPLASALLMAGVFAGVMAPLHTRFARTLRGHSGLAAGILVLAVVVVLVGPLVGLAAFLLNESSEALKFVSETVRGEGVTQLVAKLPESLGRLVADALARLTDANQILERQLGAQGGKAAAALWAVLSATGTLIFGGVVMLIAFYFLLVQGGEFVSWLDDALPLRPGHTRELLTEFKKVSYAVIVSTVITSALQASAALIGFFIAGMPRPIFFAAVTFFVAFLPAVGAASVCLFAAAILYVTGHPYSSLFLALWGLVVVGLVDNVIKPVLIKGGMEMRSAVFFFALLGGLGAFGTIGLVIGPLAVALFLALLRIYHRDFKLRPVNGVYESRPDQG